MPVNDKVAAINELVVGWMIPVMHRTDPHTGEQLNGLGMEDFGRVKAGYGCPKCLAKFKTYLVRCPVCDYTRNIEEDFQQTPDFWVDHIRDRNREELAGRDPGTPVSMDEFLAEVAADPDIEQRKL